MKTYIASLLFLIGSLPALADDVFFVVGRSLNPQFAKPVLASTARYLMEDAPPNTGVYFVDPVNQAVTSMVIPEGSAQQRLNKPPVKAAFRALRHLVLENPAQETWQEGALCIPNSLRLAHSIASKGEGEKGFRIVFIGSGPHQDRQASLTCSEGLSMSHGFLLNRFSPFFLDDAPDLKGVRAYIVTPPDTWSTLYQAETTIRFYSTYFFQKNGGALISVGGADQVFSVMKSPAAKALPYNEKLEPGTVMQFKLPPTVVRVSK